MERIKVQVLLFSVLREKVGRSEVEVTLDAPARVEDVIEQLTSVYPAIEPYRPVISPAVNQDYASLKTPVHTGDELALITPVSGG